MTEWAAQWQAWRFNTHHGPPGSGHGGQFVAASSGAGAGTKTKAGGSPHAPAPTPASAAAPVGKAAHKAALHAQAKADRVQARHLKEQLRGLEHQHRQAVRQAKASAAAAAHHHAAGRHATARHHHHAHATHHRHTVTLAQRIHGLRGRIDMLLTQANQLDARASKL